ncbi:MAG: hydrogenase nickel incorporation protein HypB [Verrucomicrobiales bacterium]|nr:hydrogenase nickel incorporation protein HypB [Verrucomicrobiales bacterium]
MCQECGCGLGVAGATSGHHGTRDVVADHSRAHAHGQDHVHDHGSEIVPGGTRVLQVQQALLDRNQRQAERNRGFIRAKGVLVLNVVSAPGSGKTELIGKTAERLGKRLRIGAIVGDLETDNDARRLRAFGVPVVPISTGTLCHLEAEMVAKAMDALDLDAIDVLFVENVGNLVCPAAYDLGEHLRVVLLSVAEGEDKPLKYPPLFHSAQVALLTKTDLAPVLGFDRAAALANLNRVAHHARVLEVSSRTGDGMEEWTRLLLEQVEAVRR